MWAFYSRVPPCTEFCKQIWSMCRPLFGTIWFMHGTSHEEFYRSIVLWKYTLYKTWYRSSIKPNNTIGSVNPVAYLWTLNNWCRIYKILIVEPKCHEKPESVIKTLSSDSYEIVWISFIYDILRKLFHELFYYSNMRTSFILFYL